ncbi:DivIVA domain-containing protein [Cryptosporangium aurantiacum]|uniref:Cell wall synthesis protein Wag31 n=1 Tax=Cryptosporangium aurantiacum TaxID=134849 RepID=A0A1M7I5I5_9ACTN|nr:DivIVA domain-containing protein [Cryptosporangium aurantiacum]SHM36062.1 DivIVA domain-containing protein [Cryptosporangium aurantiacum]
MPLTPADVHNVVFKKPPIGKRGYDEDDVDAFLDEVERELARLIEENNDLKAQVERGRTGGPAAAPAAATANEPEVRRMQAENHELKQQVERLRQETQQAKQAAAAAQQQAQSAQSQVSGSALPAVPGDDQGEKALRVLMLAQRTADDHVADARREADKLLSEARANAEELTRDARAKAEALERDARQRHQEAMGGLEAKRTALQKHIEQLKAFEREYRTRLKAYLESQLRDLEARGQATEAEINREGVGTSSLSGAFGGPHSGLPRSGDVADSHGR